MIGLHGILSVFIMKLYGWKLWNGGELMQINLGGLGLKNDR